MKKRMHILQYAVMGVSMVSMLGCGGAMINIRSLRPANIHLGQAPEVGIASIEGGRRNQQDAVVEELVAKSRSAGFFLIRDRKGEGIKFDIRNGAPVMTGAQVTMGPNDVFLSGNIIESDAEKTEEQREMSRRVKRGNQTVTETYSIMVPVFKGTAIVSFTLVSSDRIYMEQKEYAGKASVDLNEQSSFTKDDLREMAIKNAVDLMLKDITPSYLSSSVNMDKSDKGQKEILAAARSGNLTGAKQRLEEYVKITPNAAAYYNLAVLTDASGEYEAALELYDKAISMGSLPLYELAKMACMKRLNEKKALESK